MTRLNKDEGNMQIGNLAAKAGVSVRAVRYYEEIGLLHPEGHSHGGFRLYRDETLKRLRVINLMKEMGMSLTEIRGILTSKKGSPDHKDAVLYLLNVFTDRLNQISAKLDAFNHMKEELTEAVRILHSCECCQNEVLLDSASCDGCLNLSPKEKIPETFEVILQ